MGNFRALVMTMAMDCAPNGSLSPAQRAFVHQKLLEFFPDSKPTPDHPPYSWMIQRAIESLNEEGGSSEEAISEYIVKENSSLPWAHTTLLSHHLRKLRESNEIFQTVEGCYALTNPIANICPASSPNECISSEHSSDKKRVNPKDMQKKDSEKRKGKFGECNVSGEKVQTDVEKEATDEKIDVIEEGQEEPANLKLDIQPQVVRDGNAHVEPKEQAKQDFVSQECYEDEEQQLSSEQVHESGKRRGGKALKRKTAKMVVEEEEEINVQLQGLDGSARKEPKKLVKQDMMSEECNEEQQLNSEQGQQKGGRLGMILPKMRIKKVQEEENNLEIDGQPLRFEDGARKEASKQMRRDFVSEKCRGEQLNREQELEKGTRRSSRVAKRNRTSNGLEEQTNKEIHVLTQRLEDTDPEEPNEQIQQDLASEEYNKDEEQQLNTEQALEKRKRKEGKPHKNVVEALINSESGFQHQELDDAQNENKQMQQGFTSKECKEPEEQQLNREHEQMILKAIENLNEEGGSTEVAIAKYIVRNSPWGYTTLVSRHLGKLCQRNEIFETVVGYYALSRPPITNICPTSSPGECISSKHGSDRKRVNPKTIQKKDSKRRKEGKFGKCNVRGEKVQTNTDDEATEEEDFVIREYYEDEERQLNRKQVHEPGKRRPGKGLKRKRRKMVLEEEEEEEINLEVDVQGQQKGRRLPKRIKIVVQEEENNLEMDGQLLRFEDSARKEPNKKMRQDVVSEKRRREQLNREQEPQKGKRRSSRVPKRNRKNIDLEEQTNIEIHGLKDTDPEEPNEQAQQDVEIEECNKDEEKGKRKQGKPHKNVIEEPTNSESDSQPQDLDDSQNENERREAEEQQLKRKGKLGRRQQQLQAFRRKTKSSEGLLTKTSARLLQSSSQNGLQLGDRKHIKHKGSAKPQEIRRSTRIPIATSKKKEYNSATSKKEGVQYHSQ
ncbi:PREDICTED: trichohyalin-like [Ipomoea nil]|uniref:trichohyalin-like n=1 Tax=Ipomoea nil TaxID=35883 RepID=UPI000901904E|nr:PREDICTED: trichohyalin-like [Ipomoea nil]